MKKNRQRRRRGLGLICFAMLAFGGVAIFQWGNTPAVQRRIAAWVSRHTSWAITIDHWEWRPLSNTLKIVNLTMVHRTTGHHVHTDEAFLHYRPWSLLRGRLRVPTLRLAGVIADFSHMPPPRTTRARITLKKLLVVQNLQIDAASIEPVAVTLPQGHTLTAAAVRFQFLPSLLSGDIELNLQVDQVQLGHNAQPIVAVSQLSLAGRTAPKQWVNTAPFINAVRGALTLTDGAWRNVRVSQANMILRFDHSRFGLENFRAEVNEQPLEGNGAIDLEKTTYSLDLRWPQPMPIPELFGTNRLLLSAGTLQGSLALKGTGFDPQTSKGEGAADLTQIPAAVTNIPLHLKGKATWNAGLLTLHDTSLAVGPAPIGIVGTVNLREKRVAIRFHGDRVPVEGVFGRFADPHFHPLRGLAKAQGSFTGWSRNYLLEITAEGTPTQYYDIVAEQARVQFRLTWPRLELRGQILQGGKTTGQADLAIAYGPKVADAPRPKRIHLTTKLEGHDLGPSFAAYHLTGTGNGTLTLDGPPAGYRATGQAEILRGTFYALPLARVATKIAMVPRLITYTESEIALPSAPPLQLPQALKMAITDEGFRLSGTPRSGIHLDIGYRNSGSHWTVHTIAYADPMFPDRRLTITGNGATGNWNLLVRGTGNLALLEYLPATVREAAGPVALDLRISGALDNPLLNGSATLRQATLLLRTLPYPLEELQGTLRFQGRRIAFDPLTGRIGDGTFQLAGSVEQAGFHLAAYDMRLRGTTMHYASADRHFRAEVDGDLTWRGDPTRSTLAGEVTILDAKYDRDFHVLEQMTGRSEAVRAELRAVKEGWDRIGLHIRLRSTGDIWIRNNAADVALRADAAIQGSLAHPQVRGAIEVVEGKLHYLGLHFDVTHGLVEFHPPYAHPYLEMTGEKDVREYLVRLSLRGPADNLVLDLSSTPGLEQKDILALLAFGATQEELRTAQFGAQVGPSVFLEQVGKVVERPLSRLTGLDVVRVETLTGRGSGEGSRLYLGKRLSDRFSVEFVTGVSEQTSEQGFQVEYQLTDFLLLKAAQQAGEQPRVNMSLRFRER